MLCEPLILKLFDSLYFRYRYCLVQFSNERPETILTCPTAVEHQALHYGAFLQNAVEVFTRSAPVDLFSYCWSLLIFKICLLGNDGTRLLNDFNLLPESYNLVQHQVEIALYGRERDAAWPLRLKGDVNTIESTICPFYTLKFCSSFHNLNLVLECRLEVQAFRKEFCHFLYVTAGGLPSVLTPCPGYLWVHFSKVLLSVSDLKRTYLCTCNKRLLL